MHGTPHLGGHDFPQLVFRTTLATIGRGNTRLTNKEIGYSIYLQKGEKSMVSRKWVASLLLGESKQKMMTEQVEVEKKCNETKIPMFNVQ